ncbi:hypothetical protein FGO68_gene7297 [Halteria grandinella]|uniref:Uncharacterized protein n=1 Tax=Halteria grandinella TaxID=5974 RepID=A0A8J8SUK4_HALGN|nr:hypothetical protein FGO68_gene7297 [Halteria grandinella]
MLSAFFMTYTINKIAREFDGLSLGSILQLYLGRFLRYLCLYYSVLLTVWVLIWELNDAPLWSKFSIYLEECPQYWWANMGFINNFVHLSNIQNDGASKQAFQGCMIWSSFVATDLQLFLILPMVVSIYRCSQIA